MHANASGGGGGSGGQSWRVPADETLQVGGDKEAKAEQASFCYFNILFFFTFFFIICSLVPTTMMNLQSFFVRWLFINLI